MREELLVLKALINVNIPKFTLMDKELFMGILQDLFPGKEIQKETDQDFLKKLEEICRKKQLIPNESFIEKCSQFFETIQIRHGIIILGASNSGKSSVLDTVRESITDIAQHIKNHNPE
jgi:dynein heavy chain, axonemal